ncbi:hypothetical protein HMPREF3201_01464 [Megasphaera sp. MJR8396C]|nr:hypothetical protein HMPREF3201_01464 [Megasphaera sp. MJR8396C]
MQCIYSQYLFYYIVPPCKGTAKNAIIKGKLLYEFPFDSRVLRSTILRMNAYAT